MPANIGQRITRTFTAVNPAAGASLPLCEDGKFDCNYTPLVLADGTTDELKNDKSSIIGLFQTWTTGVTFMLKRNGVDLQLITNNDFGTYYPLGTWTDFPSYAGLVLDWSKILNSFGVGLYTVLITETNPLGTTETTTKPFCLKIFDCDIADNTVRLEWWLDSGIGDIDNDKKILNFTGINWYSQYRLQKSIFGYPSSTYEVESIQYSNGEILDTQDNQEETYILKIGAVPAWVHNIIKTYACQADELKITDYSKNNPQQLIKKSVKRQSAYEPRWIPNSKCAPVTLEFTPRFNRLERFRCL